MAVPDLTRGTDAGLRGVRIHIRVNCFTEKLDYETEQAVKTAVQALEGLGAVVVPVEIPQAEYLKAAGLGHHDARGQRLPPACPA